MWPFAQREQLCLILAAVCGGSFCQALRLEPRASSAFRNSTSTSSSSSSSWSTQTSPIVEPALITPTTTLLSSSSTQNFTSTITSAPMNPWGDQIIPINTCSVTASSNNEIQWTPCAVFAGTLQMSFFPQSQGNLSYPATYWNPEFGVTMTSPSIYMMVNTVTGNNDCGPLGPTYTNAVVSMDLTDVSTLQPYADHTVTTRMGPPQQLQLSDLTSNCLNTYGTFSTDGAFVNTHPVEGNFNRCRPRFVFPIQLKRIGYPYWKHCDNDNYTYGIFDPPGAVPPVDGLLPTTVATPVTLTPEPASALPTTASVHEASKTAQTTTAPASAPPLADSETTPSPADPSTPGISPPPADPTIPATASSPADLVTPADSSTLVDPTTDTRSPASSSQSHPPVATPLIPIHTSATAIATVGSQTINAIPGLSVVVLPNGSTAKPGSVATVTDSNSHPVIVSVGTSGIFIGGTSHGESTSFFANPTFPPVVIATVASNVISAAPGATHIVVGSQTASLGGPAITVSGSVIQLTPSGVVVNDGSSGAPASTFPIPTLASAHDVAAPTAIATVGGHTISAPPGASTVVIGAQVVTAGGSPITLAGSNNVASLGPNSLVIQFPGGSVSSFALPTAAPSIGGIVGTVAGISISASAGASVITVGSQAVTLGGAPITIPGNNVVSAGSSRLEIQMPGGGVSTLSAQTEASAAASVLTSSATSSNRGIASIIASIAGASQTGTVNVSSNSSSGLSTPVSETNSSGRRIEARSKLFCLWAVFCVGGRLAFGV